jgi:D-alanyl-D-alanine carboxypeptidase (penicillin-binding protein 5/6)
MDFSDVNKRKYRKKSGRRPWADLGGAVILLVVIALIFSAFKVTEVLRVQRINEAIERARVVAEEEAESVKAFVDLPAPLHSANYILLRLPMESVGFAGRDSWADLPSNQEDAEKKNYLYNQILMEKSPDAQIYPASMVKILTAITVLENVSDLNKKITITDADFNYYYRDGAAIAGYRAGDVAGLVDLLYGLMLSSGSECAAALAEETAGDEEAFVALMNAKAAEIGMSSSHFTNPVGLHNAENYSTVSDIALLLDYALQNRTFTEIFTAAQYTSAPVGSHPTGLEVNSTLHRAELAGQILDDGIVMGGKTGFLDESGQCLASLISKGNVRFILVTAAAMPENSHTQALHIDDMLTVLNAITVSGS